ncbi:hypothetical protein T01_3355 [Trichinella spiralis]|uniref:Uncharacterized protein n=1 Tax=Trichinella spiralis TaxID=6334 RepID=A0A0V1BNX3_TRISP|nr:hypothetical protein T01_3355 [Trichinella spiralis]
MSFVRLCAVRSVLSNQSVYTTDSTLMLLRLDWKNKRNKFSPSADVSTHIYSESVLFCSEFIVHYIKPSVYSNAISSSHQLCRRSV